MYGRLIFRNLLLLPLVLLSFACGHKGGVAEGVRPVRLDPLSGTDAALRLLRTREAARSAELRCDFEGECHPSVAMVTVVTSQGLARCSGILISEDEVLTNDHCISLSLGSVARPERFEEIPCEGEVFAHFAPIGEGASLRVGCESIRFRSGERGIGSVDYAILRLKDRVQGRPTVVVSKRGLQDREEVGIFRVQMDGDTGFGGTQSLLNCQVSHRTFVYPQIDHADSPLMTLGDCPIVLGNSGAPVFNSAGELAGIIQGYLAVRQNAELESELREHLLDGTFGLTGVATQVHCLRRIGSENPALCIDLPALEAMSVKDFLTKHLPGTPADLPPAGEGWTWYPLPTEGGLSRTFRSGPACAAVPEFDSVGIDFKPGIDSRLQAGWKRTDSEAGSLRLKKTAEESGRVIFSSGSVSLGIQACQSI